MSRTLRILGSPDEIAPLADHTTDALLTAQDVATRLRCNPATVYEMARRGALPTVRFAGSRLVRFSGRALDALIARGGAEEWR